MIFEAALKVIDRILSLNYISSSESDEASVPFRAIATLPSVVGVEELKRWTNCLHFVAFTGSNGRYNVLSGILPECLRRILFRDKRPHSSVFNHVPIEGIMDNNSVKVTGTN